jgi:hypothetical protein
MIYIKRKIKHLCVASQFYPMDICDKRQKYTKHIFNARNCIGEKIS